MKRFVVGISVGLVLVGLLVVGARTTAGADIEKGKSVYDAKKCSMCHAIGGKGGKTGPDLSDVGNKRDAAWLTKFFKDPKGTVPGSKHAVVRASDEELAALADYLASLKK